MTTEVDKPGLENIKLDSIIDHRCHVSPAAELRTVYLLLRNQEHAFAAVVQEGRALGLCFYEQIASLLERDTTTVDFTRSLISSHILAKPLFINQKMKLRDALILTFGRQGSDFLQDIIVVENDMDKKFVGLISFRKMVELQSGLLNEQVDKLAQNETLLRQTLQQQFRTTVELRRSQNNDQNYKQMLRSTVQQQFRTTMELRRAQARYHILFENSGVGVALMDSDARLTTYNRHLARLLLLSDAPEQESIDFGAFLSPANREEFLDTLKKLQNDGKSAVTTVVEYPVLLGPEKMAHFHFTLNFIPETNQLCACVLDMTEERQLQKHLLQKEKDVLLNSLVGGIAHELNNKVQPLLGYTELLTSELDDGRDTGKIHQYGEVIKKSGSDCAAIVHQLLQLCQSDSGLMIDCQLQALTENALVFVAYRLRDANITVIKKLQTEPIHILADPKQLQQIIANLIFNAIDAMQFLPHRELTVTTQSVEQWAMLEIQDTGQGIAHEVLPHIFNPFFTTKPGETARGLGLSVSRSIARLHKGEISVQSAPGEGSLFTVRLPLQKPMVETAVNELIPAQTTSLPLTLDRQRRVLVVDDEPFVGGLVEEILRRKLSVQVERANNGEEGIQKLKAGTYDLVISDVRMPVMNGAEFFRWLEENQPQQRSRFFFMTGHEGTADTSSEVNRAQVPILRKPFTPDALVKLCRSILV